LEPGYNFEQALEDLRGFERIWVIFRFHQNRTWKPKVYPPRGGVKRGLFATRSPHRPNPIGLSSVELLDIQGLQLRIAGHDLLEGTEVLDIKPYIPYADAFPDARAGWVDELEEEAPYKVAWMDQAKAGLEWLKAQGGPDLQQATRARLELGPTPGRNRRVRSLGQGKFELACRTWRLRYHVDSAARSIEVQQLCSGYTAEALAKGQEDPWGDKSLHRRFLQAFPLPY
jgi:tRNA-Thr(GGU) m(6)t(6)A37 methyltransferase TsaA